MNNLTLNNTKSKSIILLAIKDSDTTWVLVSACLIFLMIPGYGIYHGGILQRKNHLTLLTVSILSVSIISIQWFLYGYSFSFSQNGLLGLVGNLDNIGMINIGTEPHPAAPTIPANLFALFHGLLAAISPCIAFGSPAERTPLSVYLIFLLVWSTLVYDMITYWTLSPNGWLNMLGCLDFAGGSSIHITAGFSGLAYSIVVGSRQLINFKKTKPTNNFEIFLGTILIWLACFGFNGGSVFSINSNAVNAIINTNISACSAGLTWVLTNMIRNRSKLISLSGFCSGVLAGLVAISSSSGYISTQYSFIFGLLAGCLCNLACDIKNVTWLNIDDACNVFAVHGIGGIIGQLLTGIFADNSIIIMSGNVTQSSSGWLNGNFKQLLYQLISILTTSIWSFTVTFILLILIRFIPCINIRYSMVKEEIGSDLVEIGTSTYGHDLLYLDNQKMNQQDHQYLVKSKYGSLPNKNRTSSLIYDDEPIITEYIEEIFEPSMLEPQVYLPSYYDYIHQQNSINDNSYQINYPTDYHYPRCLYHNYYHHNYYY